MTDDGLAADGPLHRVYQVWRYPDDCIDEAYGLDGPKTLRHVGWCCMFSSVGVPAGPPSRRIVIIARSRSIHGPWEDCPRNPVVRTQSIDEPWWSRGHATAVQGPRDDEWWLVYHGYESNYRTLGRRMLLDPFEWDSDGW